MNILQILSLVFVSLMPIVLYHRIVVQPYLTQMMEREVYFKIIAERSLAQLEQCQKELKMSQQIIKNMSADARAMVRKDILPSFVYFIANRGQGTVKIGISTDPEKRLSQLQTSNHDQLEILAVMEADERTEGLLHRRFKSHRLSGEWFTLSPEILGFIQNLGPFTPQ